MIHFDKPHLIVAALLAVCSLYLPQRANAQKDRPVALDIYPNPGHHTVMVTLPWQPYTLRSVSIKVHDKAGKLVSVNEKLLYQWTWALFIDQLPVGEYYVVVTFETLPAFGSFVKVN